MQPPTLEVADIFRLHGAAYREAQPLPIEQLRVMRAIEVCRTASFRQGCMKSPRITVKVILRSDVRQGE